jgi:hypothetical protein
MVRSEKLRVQEMGGWWLAQSNDLPLIVENIC